MPAAELTSSINLAIDDPRPVSRAIDEFTKIDAYPVSYEDPQYEYAEDLRDVTAEVRAARSGARVVVPAGGSLEVRGLPVPIIGSQMRASASEREDVAQQAMQRILEVQASRSNGGRFAVEQSGEVLHVVPTLVRNREGEWVQQTSVLNTRITITPGERTAIEMVNEMCAAVSKAAGTKVGLASGPLRSLHAAKALQGADNELARDVLMRTLNQAGGYMTWKLFFAPDLRWYGLNVVALPRAVKSVDTPDVPTAPGAKLPGAK